MKELQSITANQKLYIESAGRQDREGLRQALNAKGAGTVVRLCIWRLD